jgi:class 3 adenylate cyclase
MSCCFSENIFGLKLTNNDLGLPAPQEKHASIMVRFAAECRAEMNVKTAELASKLGPDTADLKLRIGLHSGPVTAGVLRYVSCRGRVLLF